MKRILITAIILLAWAPAWAGSTTVVVGQGSAAPAGGAEITDDFSTDTSANYTAITNSMSVSGGVAHGQTWHVSRLYHETTLSSADHYAQADCVVSNNMDHSFLMARCDGTHYYRTCLRDGNKVVLYRDTTLIDTFYGSAGQFAAGTYTVKISVSGTGATVNIKVDVGGTNRIDYNDTDAGRLTTGSYVGIGFARDSDNGDCTVDNLTADNL